MAGPAPVQGVWACSVTDSSFANFPHRWPISYSRSDPVPAKPDQVTERNVVGEISNIVTSDWMPGNRMALRANRKNEELLGFREQSFRERDAKKAYNGGRVFQPAKSTQLAPSAPSSVPSVSSGYAGSGRFSSSL